MSAYGSQSLLSLWAFLAAWHLFTIVVHDIGLLWFDDLIDISRFKDPRVQSVRRLSLHVVMPVVKIVLLFAVIYRWIQPGPEVTFRQLIFYSFETSLTLNYDASFSPLPVQPWWSPWLWSTRRVWMIQVNMMRNRRRNGRAMWVSLQTN
jgi:hypothetical protein